MSLGTETKTKTRRLSVGRRRIIIYLIRCQEFFPEIYNCWQPWQLNFRHLFFALKKGRNVFTHVFADVRANATFTTRTFTTN